MDRLNSFSCAPVKLDSKSIYWNLMFMVDTHHVIYLWVIIKIVIYATLSLSSSLAPTHPHTHLLCGLTCHLILYMLLCYSRIASGVFFIYESHVVIKDVINYSVINTLLNYRQEPLFQSWLMRRIMQFNKITSCVKNWWVITYHLAILL